MEITPDHTVFWEWGWLRLNATIVFTWAVMAIVVAGSWLATRRLARLRGLSRAQALVELIVDRVRSEIREVAHHNPDRYLPFSGTLFLFIAVSNLLAVVPGYRPPTGSLSTTAALALCVFVAVPLYGIAERGLVGFLKHYIQPTVFMLPLHVISEISRTFALAVRLFGNIMSGTMIAGILVTVAPFFFPTLMDVLGLLIGLIQAYIFAVLAMVYIAAATRAYHEREASDPSTDRDSGGTGLSPVAARDRPSEAEPQAK